MHFVECVLQYNIIPIMFVTTFGNILHNSFQNKLKCLKTKLWHTIVKVLYSF